jgi:hypothetical protein
MSKRLRICDWFYQLRGGRIAAAKIYREGSAEVA